MYRILLYIFFQFLFVICKFTTGVMKCSTVEKVLILPYIKENMAYKGNSNNSVQTSLKVSIWNDHLYASTQSERS